MTPEAPALDANAHGEAVSRSQTSSKSKASFRLYFFTFLSVVACGLALANVAMAASPSGEDQYIEQAPNGAGDTSQHSTDAVDLNNDGVITNAEVRKAAEKQAKKRKSERPVADDEGSTGATGAATSGTTPTPPAAQSVATSAKIGPLSRKTAVMLGIMALLIGLGASVFGGAGDGFLGLGGKARAGTPPSTH
jgi:hypothetical protein